MEQSFSLLLSSGSHYPYKIVSSKRTKYIRIKLSQYGDLTVTVPSHAKHDSAHDFIHSKREWIEKKLRDVSYQSTEPPDVLDLTLLNEVWTIEYIEESSIKESYIKENSIKESRGSGLKLKEKSSYRLEVTGTKTDLGEITLINHVLNQWCRKKAKTIFNQMLQEQAELHGFHYQRLSIRAQKTRWGSCSGKKNINLNCKLLFMPEAVVKYVMIHELCHTIEMNHSSRFWNLVEECDPDYKANKVVLNTLGRMIKI